MDRESLSVTELGALIGERLRNVFATDLWVRGEIRDLNRARSGHVYFSLVDGDGATSGTRLPVMLHSRDRVRVNRLLTRAGGGVRMVDGTEVRIRVRVDFYEPRGQLQLRMRSIDPAFTLGQLAAARAELLQRLRTDDLIDANGRIPMPALPLRVRLVTAASSDAAADAIHELTASGFAFSITVHDVPVQGPHAPEAIAATLDALGAGDADGMTDDADHRDAQATEPGVVLLVRGGGSASDLAAYDHELVARAIARHPRPVVTGIGHELDRAVADEVAAVSAKTPTAAARVVVERVAAAFDRVELAHDRIVAASHGRLRAAGERLDDHRRRVERAAITGTRGEERRIRFLEQRTAGAARRAVRREQARVATLGRTLPVAATRAVDRHRDRLDTVAARVDAIDPARALARGWSMTRRLDGTLVRDPDQVVTGDVVVTTVAGGTLVSVVSNDPVPPHDPRQPDDHEAAGNR